MQSALSRPKDWIPRYTVPLRLYSKLLAGVLYYDLFCGGPLLRWTWYECTTRTMVNPAPCVYVEWEMFLDDIVKYNRRRVWKVR